MSIYCILSLFKKLIMIRKGWGMLTEVHLFSRERKPEAYLAKGVGVRDL